MSFLAKDVLPVEDKQLFGISESSIPVEASRQAASASFMVFRLQAQVAFYKERAATFVVSMKGTKNGLEEAKKYVADFELVLTKKDLEGNQKEANLKLKVQELEVKDAKLRKKDQLLTASATWLKEHIKESEELRVELQLKEEEISRLFDDAECQFDAGANSALDAIKSRFPDLNYSLLDQPLDQGPASIASNSGMSAPGSSVPALELASWFPD